MIWSQLHNGKKNAFIPSCYADEIMTDMPYPIYPEGLYHAIVELSETGLPIYITENGIDDRDQDDWRRDKWIREYLKMVSLAIEDGYDVRGFYYWSLTDNFEWDMGWKPKFGLYSVNFDSPRKERTLKKGAFRYADIVKAAGKGAYRDHTSDYVAQA